MRRRRRRRRKKKKKEGGPHHHNTRPFLPSISSTFHLNLAVSITVLVLLTGGRFEKV